MEQWADELISRVQFYRSLGVNVTTVGIQNESNWSHEGTQTCRWEPDRLKTFIEQFIQPRLEANHLTDLLVAAPDLAYIGPDASEFIRYAGFSEITPATLGSEPMLETVISLSPPNITTVPTSYSESDSYISAKSAYCADVAFAYTVLYFFELEPISLSLIHI